MALRATFKSFDEALLEMIQAYWGSLGTVLPPDLVPGSAERSMLEAVAFQVADLSARADYAIQTAIPTAVYDAFGFTRAAATKATTTLRFTAPRIATSAIAVPLGTRARTADGIEFETTTETTIAIGQLYVDVAARAVNAGAKGNQATGAINLLSSAVPGVSKVSSIALATGGSDSESDAAMKKRFADYIIELDKSSIGALTLALAKTTDSNGNTPDLVSVIDYELDSSVQPGAFKYYAYKRGGMSAELVNNLLATAKANRAAGTRVITGTLTVVPVNVNAEIRVRSSGARSTVQAAISSYFTSLGIGEKVSWENLIAVIKNASTLVVEPELYAPTADLPGISYQKYELGSLVITETTV